MTVAPQLDRRAAVEGSPRRSRRRWSYRASARPPTTSIAVGDHDGNFYLWGAMGGAALIALGLAQAQPGKRVLVFTGDGEQLMGLGGLATIGGGAAAQPRHRRDRQPAFWRDRHAGEPYRAAASISTGSRRACGFAETATVRTLAEVRRLARSLREPAEGPRLFVIKVVGRKSAALAALARRRLYQEPVPCPSRLRGGLNWNPSSG